MLEATSNFYTRFPPSFLSSASFPNCCSLVLFLSGDEPVRSRSLASLWQFFSMGNNGGILTVQQIGENLVSGLIIVNMLKKKKIAKTLSLSILQVSFSVSSN